MFPFFYNVHAWVKAGFAIQYLHTHITGMLKLETLAFFESSADEVVSSLNGGSQKQFLVVLIKCLKLLTTNLLLRNV